MLANGKLSIEMPPALADGLFRHRRYKVLHGGRGSGKSWSVARALIALASSKNLRVLCAREVQLSIRDSVHRLLSDQISQLKLDRFFDVTRDEIRCPSTGSLFIFAGLSTQTVDSIKSFEGVDIVWVEEAQSVSKRSWDVLLPTIREPGSEVWMTLNPDLDTDETYRRFVANAGPLAWVQAVNWRDNPWFSRELEDERLETQRLDPDGYANIWDGVPKRVAEGAIYRLEVDQLYLDGRAANVPKDPRLTVHTVWDLGWADSMAIALVQRTPVDIRVIDYIEDRNRTLEWYVAALEKRGHRYGLDFIPHDGAAKDFKTGKSTEEHLEKFGRQVRVLPRLSVEEGIKAARLVFPRVYIDETKGARLLECLRRYRRAINRATLEADLPLHDEYSHGADCFRYLGQSVDLMVDGDPADARKFREMMAYD